MIALHHNELNEMKKINNYVHRMLYSSLPLEDFHSSLHKIFLKCHKQAKPNDKINNVSEVEIAQMVNDGTFRELCFANADIAADCEHAFELHLFRWHRLDRVTIDQYVDGVGSILDKAIESWLSIVDTEYKNRVAALKTNDDEKTNALTKLREEYFLDSNNLRHYTLDESNSQFCKQLYDSFGDNKIGFHFLKLLTQMYQSPYTLTKDQHKTKSSWLLNNGGKDSQCSTWLSQAKTQIHKTLTKNKIITRTVE